MIRVPWALEEAAVLMDLYFGHGATLSIPTEELLQLSQLYQKRAKLCGLHVDKKFRKICKEFYAQYR